jgi:uncharacterized damage-inducible protein DinB
LDATAYAVATNKGVERAVTIAEEFLKQSAAEARRMKVLADRAMAQVGDEELHRAPDSESNSIAVIAQHIAGNLRSRFTDFLTSDGEKDDRDRDAEFVDQGWSREELLRRWEEGWERFFTTVAELREGDLLRTVTIRGEPHTVIRAVERSVSHSSYHCGQIVFLAKAIRSGDWQTLSIARGASSQFNEAMRAAVQREERR